MNGRLDWLTIVSLCSCGLLTPLAGGAAEATAAGLMDIELTEWRVPISMERDGTLVDDYPGDGRSMTRPRDPGVDGEGNVWFCGQAGNYIGRLDPSTGQFTRYEVPANSNPHNLIVSDDGYIWYAGNRNGHIGRLDPRTGDVKRFDLPDESVRDPHTLTFNDEGNIWFTAQQSNYVGLLNTRNGEYSLIEVPHPSARPYGIMLDSNDHPWIALFGTNRIATVDPKTMKLRSFVLPNEDARPRRLAVTSDDKVWYVDYARGYLGRFAPETETFTEWQAPGGDKAVPYAMTVDDEDRLWFVESPDRQSYLVGFDPDTGRFIAREAIPSGGFTARYMVHVPRNDTLWFGTDANTMVRASLPGR